MNLNRLKLAEIAVEQLRKKLDSLYEEFRRDRAFEKAGRRNVFFVSGPDGVHLMRAPNRNFPWKRNMMIE